MANDVQTTIENARTVGFAACALRFFHGVTLGHSMAPERIACTREPRKLAAVPSPDGAVSFLQATPSLEC